MKCQYPGCDGAIDDGFCDACGRPPAGAGSQISADTGSVYSAPGSTGQRAGGTSGQIMSSRSSSSRSRSARARGTTSRRRAGLGAGLLELPSQPPVDPLESVLTDPRVPERRRVCPALIYHAPGGDLLALAEAQERGIPADALGGVRDETRLRRRLLPELRPGLLLQAQPVRGQCRRPQV